MDVANAMVYVRVHQSIVVRWEVGAMKWVDDLRASAAAFRDWGRLLTIVGFVMAGSLVVIAIELFVICLKI